MKYKSCIILIIGFAIIFGDKLDPADKSIANADKQIVSDYQEKKSKRNQIIQRIIFGVFTAGFAAAAYRADVQMKNLSKDYDNSTHSNQEEYNRIWDNIKKYQKQRQIFMAASASSGILFMVSISF